MIASFTWTEKSISSSFRAWKIENPWEKRFIVTDYEKVFSGDRCSWIKQLFCTALTVILTGDSYKHLLAMFFLSTLSIIPLNTISQQDDAPPHWSLEMQRPLDEKLLVFGLDEKFQPYDHRFSQIWLLLIFSNENTWKRRSIRLVS